MVIVQRHATPKIAPTYPIVAIVGPGEARATAAARRAADGLLTIVRCVGKKFAPLRGRDRKADESVRDARARAAEAAKTRPSSDLGSRVTTSASIRTPRCASSAHRCGVDPTNPAGARTAKERGNGSTFVSREAIRLPRREHDKRGVRTVAARNGSSVWRSSTSSGGHYRRSFAGRPRRRLRGTHPGRTLRSAASNGRLRVQNALRARFAPASPSSSSSNA